MATLDDVEKLALALPEVTQTLRHGNRSWAVREKVFAWERPFSKADIKRFGERIPPAGPIAAVSTADLAEKEALLAAHPATLFTIAHFDGYPAVLIRLTAIGRRELREVILEGWLARAPQPLAEEYLKRR
jgi:hypothetical protein